MSGKDGCDKFRFGKKIKHIDRQLASDIFHQMKIRKPMMSDSYSRTRIANNDRLTCGFTTKLSLTS